MPDRGAAVLRSGLHVSNDFLLFAIPVHEIVFVLRKLVSGGGWCLTDGESMYFVAFAQSITLESIIL